MDHAKTIAHLLADLITFVWLLMRPTRRVAAENLFLRKQLALYKERGVKPRRASPATRLSLVATSKLFEWKHALAIVQPRTFAGWHRRGFRLFWRWKSRIGRPPIPAELKGLIREMASSNPTWGEGRIADELLLKLGLRVSPRTVAKYIPNRPRRGPRGDQRWSTFVRNHADTMIACDFCVVVTAAFRLLYIFVVIEHGTRRTPTCQCHRASDGAVDASAVARSDTG